MSKNIFSTVLSLLFFFGVFAQNEIKVVKIEDLKKENELRHSSAFINKPLHISHRICNEIMKGNIQLIFVSLDNAGAYKKLPAKMKKLGVEAPVYLLNESSDYSWLPYIDKRWQGSIPATMIINTKKNVKAFFETPMDKGQLEFYLKKLGL